MAADVLAEAVVAGGEVAGAGVLAGENGRLLVVND